VRKEKADLGIIWDGDGDRIIFIDDNGKFIEPYYINCLLSKIFLEKFESLKIKNKKVVVDARLRLAINEAIVKNEGKVVVSRSGYTNFIMEMKKNKALFGCENSGHYFLNFLLWQGEKNNFVFSDGIIPAFVVIEYLSINDIKLSRALAPFKKAYKISGEINLENKKFDKLSEKIIKKFSAYKPDISDGLSFNGDGWFFNIRPSNTEPLVRLNIEADSKKTVEDIKRKLIRLI
jgi:phosphomannomutase